MLNWIAYWGGSYLFGRDGPLQNHFNKAVPISDDIVDNAKLPTLGQPASPALHVGIFIAVGGLIAFYHPQPRRRSATRFAPSAFNPRQRVTAAYSVARNFTHPAMAISGLFAGLAGGLDILAGSSGRSARRSGVEHRLHRHPVALLGRNTAVGVGLAGFAVRRAADIRPTSRRSLDHQEGFPPVWREDLPDDRRASSRGSVDQQPPNSKAARPTPTAVVTPSSATAMPMSDVRHLNVEHSEPGTASRGCRGRGETREEAGDRHRQDDVARDADAAVTRCLRIEADGANLVAERRPFG